MINVIHVTVMVQDLIWEEFLISQDHVLFITLSSPNGKGEPIENIGNELTVSPHEDGAVIPSCINKDTNNDQRSCGPETIETINQISISSCEEGNPVPSLKLGLGKPKCVQKLYINGYLLSLFVKTLQQSAAYRRSFVANFKNFFKNVGKISHENGIMEFCMKLACPHKQIIDFAWNERLERLTIERRELDNAMSWLSTLGGAFSALGEEFKHCAQIAGRISAQQFSIALRLGDPMTVARCKLYLALSLVQTGHLASARRIVQQQYRLARSAPVLDVRLISMCLGIWAKLKYEYHKRRKGRKKQQGVHHRLCQDNKQ